eukprot:g3282.t1
MRTLFSRSWRSSTSQALRQSFPLQSRVTIHPELNIARRCTSAGSCAPSPSPSGTHTETKDKTKLPRHAVAIAAFGGIATGISQSDLKQYESAQKTHAEERRVAREAIERTRNDAKMSGRKDLYPHIEKPNRSGFLQVTDTHKVYWEECGNPKGKPVIFVHGGPGGGIDVKYRRFFDPAVYRIILFDQRGCGNSTPHACLEENTTWDLIHDMEQIRRHLKVEKWQVFGGSWGACLSLSYSICHPDRVSELVLRGIFMLRPHELQFYYQWGASMIFPDLWENYRDLIPPNEQHDMIAAYHKRLVSEDQEVRLRAAKAWTGWEMNTSNLYQEEDYTQKTEDDQFSLAFARIENHYFSNKGFFPSENWILDNVYKIRHIPTVIVQGRYDVVCPMKTAWDLHRAFPEAEFVPPI